MEAKHLKERADILLDGEGSLLEAEDTAVTLDNCLQNLQVIIGAFSNADLENEENVDLHRELTRVARVLGRTRERLRTRADASSNQYNAPVIRDGSMGRPRLQITEDQLRTFQQLGFTWIAMARMLGKIFSNIYIYVSQVL